MSVSLSQNNIKVPEPNITNGSNSNSTVSFFPWKKQEENNQNVEQQPKQRQYNRPQVGVLNVPTISKTPVYDAYVAKQKEMPYTKYKIANTDRIKNLNINNLISGSIFILGLISLFSRKK